MEGGIICKFKLNVRKVDSDEEDSNFECYDRSEKKPVHANFDKELTEGNKPTLAMLPKKSEEDEIINSGETRDRDGNMNLRRSNWLFEPLERLGKAPYFQNWNMFTGPIRKKHENKE